MIAAIVIGSTLVGAAIGGGIGLTVPVEGGDDLGIGQGIHAIGGVVMGGFAGVVVSSVLVSVLG